MTTGENVPATTRQIMDLNKAIVVRGPKGVARRIISNVHLSEADGSMCLLIKGMKAKGNWPAKPPVYTPTAPAIKAISGKIGFDFRYPKVISVNGEEKNSGYKDSDGTLYYACDAAAFTANGQPVIVRRVVSYNVHRYNLMDLFAKAKNTDFEKYFKMKPFRGRNDNGQLLGPPDGDEDRWAGYQVDNAVNLWVDCECPGYFTWGSEMNRRIMMADRTAQTFAERNAILAHPAFPLKRKFQHPEADVQCVAWVAQKGTINFDELEKVHNVEITGEGAPVIDLVEDEEQLHQVRAEEGASVQQGDVVEGEEPPDDDDLDFTGDGAKDKKEEAAGSSFPPAGTSEPLPEVETPGTDAQKQGLIDAITIAAKNVPITFVKACDAMDVDAEKLMDADVDKLLEIERLIKDAINTAGK